MVGLTIRNQENENDRPIRLTFRRKDQIYGEVIWNVFEKVSQSNSRFSALDRLVIEVHSIKMPVAFGRGIKTKGRPLSVMAHLKTSIMELQAEEKCLAHALIIAIAKVTNCEMLFM
jgi:hypothetical protein